MSVSKLQADVLLISLPFYSPFVSCYQIEFLRSAIEEKGVSCRCLHSYKKFGDLFLRNGNPLHLKRLLSDRYFGDYLILAREKPDKSKAILSEMINALPYTAEYDAEFLSHFYSAWNQMIDHTIDEILESGCKVIGLSSTHYQLVPSLYLAREIKSRRPDIKIVLGGYLSSEATSRDILDMHPYIDFIIFGDGEISLPKLCLELVEGGPDLTQAGNSAYGPRAVILGERAKALVTLPKFDSYINTDFADEQDLQRTTFNFELSRGCYWDKCDFCNFNIAYGKFRNFNYDDVLAEMDRLYEEYGIYKFIFLDTSLPPKFANFLMRENIERRHFDIFTEIMIDFDVNQMKALADFGVKRVQVGIESFSTTHLVDMRKNATKLENIRNLKHCLSYGIEPVYGIMIDRPTDLVSYYDEMEAVLPKISHLPPAKYASECDLRAGSPLFEEAGKEDFTVSFTGAAFDKVLPAKRHNCELRPSNIVWKNSEVSRERLSVFKAYINKLYADWKSKPKPKLEYLMQNKKCIVSDTRFETASEYTLGELDSEVLVLLEDVRDENKISEQTGRALSVILASLARLSKKQLIEEDRGLYISLAMMVDSTAIHKANSSIEQRRATKSELERAQG